MRAGGLPPARIRIRHPIEPRQRWHDARRGCRLVQPATTQPTCALSSTRSGEDRFVRRRARTPRGLYPEHATDVRGAAFELVKGERRDLSVDGCPKACRAYAALETGTSFSRRSRAVGAEFACRAAGAAWPVSLRPRSTRYGLPGPCGRWGLSVPHVIRRLLAAHASVPSAVLRTVRKGVAGWYEAEANAAGIERPEKGAVAFTQCFGGPTASRSAV